MCLVVAESGDSCERTRTAPGDVWAEYRPVHPLGCGTSATVQLATHTLSGRQVAVKSIAKGRVDPAKWPLLWAEVEVLRKVCGGQWVWGEGRLACRQVAACP